MATDTSELHMLTTTDNPYDPFTRFDEWREYDESHGYFSSSLLARVLITAPDLSDADQDQALEDAIDEVVSENSLGIFKKVTQTATNVDSS